MLERFEPGIGDAHTAEWCVRLPVLTLAVPVRPSRDAESQPLGAAHQPLLDRGRVTGVADLDTVESLVLKDAELGLGAVIAQMRRHGEPTHVVHERGDLAELGQRLLDVRRPAAAQVTPECVACGRPSAPPSPPRSCAWTGRTRRSRPARAPRAAGPAPRRRLPGAAPGRLRARSRRRGLAAWPRSVLLAGGARRACRGERSGDPRARTAETARGRAARPTARAR